MNEERSHSRHIRPVADIPPAGLTTYDAKDPDTSFPPIEPLRPPKGAPNVLIVLLDVRMPGMDGFETAHRISERHPNVVVVLISVEESAAIAAAAESSGAVTLVRKQEFGPSMLRRLWQTYKSPDSRGT